MAARMSTLVHGDGGPEDIHQILGALDDREKDALIVVLAGLSDPDRPLAALLGWVDFDEHGRPVDADYESQATLRQIAEALGDGHEGEFIDEIAVARCLAGRPAELSKAERIVVIQRGAARGLEWKDFDQLFGHTPGYTQQFFAREQERAARHGEVLESGVRPPRRLTEDDVRQIRVLAVERGWPIDRLTRKWDVSVSLVRKIVSGEVHRNVGGPIRPRGGPVAGPRVTGRLSTPEKKTIRQSAAS